MISNWQMLFCLGQLNYVKYNVIFKQRQLLCFDQWILYLDCSHSHYILWSCCGFDTIPDKKIAMLVTKNSPGKHYPWINWVLKNLYQSFMSIKHTLNGCGIIIRQTQWDYKFSLMRSGNTQNASSNILLWQLHTIW